jgi:hypothetical protein
MLIRELARLGGNGSVGRRILVARNRGVGREILRRLALDGPGWIGLEHGTPGSLAQELVSAELGRDGVSLVDELEQRALVDEALDLALAEEEGRLAALAEGVGFREAVANAVEALRLAGVGLEELRAAALDDRPKQEALAATLERYERELAERGLVDQADVFRRAIANVEAAGLPPAGILLLPDLGTRGLAGRFVEALRAQGAEVLLVSPVHGLPPPRVLSSNGSHAGAGRGAEASTLAWLHAVSKAPAPTPEAGEPDLFTAAPAPDAVELELFAAGSPTDELREVLRRVLASGRPWDEVEIVATDAIDYGCALDALATRLGVPVTYAVGVPLERARQGRAATAYLRWIQEDFPAAILRELLENGDVRPHLGRGESAGTVGEPEAGAERGPSGERLARRLRHLRVGWGRERYVETIDAAIRWLDQAPVEPEHDARSPEQIAESRVREREELTALRSLLDAILRVTPAVPDRLGRGPRRVTPAALARGLLGFLRYVPAPTPVEREARQRLTERLERVAQTLTRETAFGSALAILRGAIDLRIPTPGTEGPLPWSSAGGAIHFTDVAHGGWTGRPLTFVVGLDAERWPGTGIQDPILLDDDRKALAPDALPSSIERLHEARWSLAALLARLRGTVAMSYTAWDALEGREVAPAPEILQAFRLRERDPHLTYEVLHAALRPVRGPLPREAARLDASDAWLGALHDVQGGILLAGLDVVRAAHPALDRGLLARDARRSAEFTRWDGRIEPRPERLDPRRGDVVLSPTVLENLGTCSLRYLYARVLRADPPDDPEYDPTAWLDPLQRGAFLHDVYEHALRRARERGVEAHDPGFELLALEVLYEQVERYRLKVPVPSAAVLAAETAALEGDVRSFVRMVREHPRRWVELELRFGYGKGSKLVELPVAGGSIKVRGRIDRIDVGQGDGVVVIDYKTGKTYSYQSRFGTWHGGRHLQHLVYSRVVAQELGRPVERFEYWFPTARGENEIRPYPGSHGEAGDRALDAICETLASGAFAPTDDPQDCEYCDYKNICRATVSEWREVDSPPAEWSKEHGAAVEALRHLRTLRGLDEQR